MGLITRYLGQTTVSLAATARTGKPRGQKSSSKKIDKVKPELLEDDWKFDPISFSLVNKQVQLIMHAGFELLAENKATKKFFDEFFENIGYIGEPITFEELFEGIFQDQLMYGNSFVELVYDEKDEKVVDLALLDAKKVDYARDSNKKVALDDYNRPIGYVYKLPTGSSGRDIGDQPPKEYDRRVSLATEDVFMLPKRIAHFKLFTYGDRLWGVGILEPSHSSTFRKRKIEEANTNTIYTRATNPLIAEVGDERHEATPQHIEDTLDTLSNLQHNRIGAFANWVKVKTLDVKPSDIVQDTLDYLRLNQVAPAGIPLAFATGSGEATNRATLNNQQQIMELSLEDYVKKTISCFKKYVLKPIAQSNDQREVPRIRWGDVRAEEKNEKAKRLIDAVNAGILTPEEVKSYFKKVEDIDDEQNPT